MRLIDIIRAVSWPEFESAFIREYPDWQSDLSEYERVYSELLSMSPLATRLTIGIDFILEENDSYNHVYGVGYLPEEPKNEGRWALDFTDWAEWIAMEIEESTLTRYEPADIAVHCLWEMTFFSYSRKAISDKLAEINRQVEEYSRERDEHRDDTYRSEIPNKKTKEAIREARSGKLNYYDSVEALFKELGI